LGLFNQSEGTVLRCLSRALSSGALTDGIFPASESARAVLAAMPQSLPACRDPAFSQASIQQIHLRDSITEYQRGHRAGLRCTILRMRVGNMTPD
jgi:hypothetical protein